MTEHLTENEQRELAAVKRKLEQAERLVPLLDRFYTALVLEHAQGRPLEENTYRLLLSDAQEALAALKGSK